MEKHDWYFEFCKTAALKSPDEERQVGCVLVNKTSGAVIAIGFNGFIRGAPDKLLPKSGLAKHDYMIHAEQNLIYNCARHGISMDNTVLYSTLSPCQWCTRALVQVGITKVYVKEFHSTFLAVSKMKDVKVIVNKLKDYSVLEYQCSDYI